MFVKFYKARRIADRIRRRVRFALGKPDPTPWIIHPRGRKSSSAYVDFAFGLDYVSHSGRLVQLLREAMEPMGLSFLLVNKSNVEQIIRQTEQGLFHPHVYLDLCASPNSPFDQLINTAYRHGIYTVRKPQDNQWVLKADSHERLAKEGMPLPPTVILRRDQPDRDLTPEERMRLGDRCVIKPSFGEATKGVKLNVNPTLDVIANARNYNRKDDYLIQRMMTWGRLGGRPAYLRGYNVLGHRSLLWWVLGPNSYATLTWADLHRYDLLPCLDIMNRLADITKMDFFSTEIAITSEPGVNRFCLIDYVNDACDIDPQSGKNVPPESWVKWVCERFAEFTWRRKHNLPQSDCPTVYLGPHNGGQILDQLKNRAPTTSAAA